jgi:hypothetical protein
MEKRCKVCGEIKPITLFQSKGKQGGYKSKCFSCNEKVRAVFRSKDGKWKTQIMTKSKAEQLIKENKARWKGTRLLIFAD